MVVCVAVTPDGQIDPRWGRASSVAIAEVGGGTLGRWEEFQVRWDELHDTGTEGGHHARVARFMREHQVAMVVARHMGPDMHHMLERLGIDVRLGAAGDARDAVLAAVGATSQTAS